MLYLNSRWSEDVCAGELTVFAALHGWLRLLFPWLCCWRGRRHTCPGLWRPMPAACHSTMAGLWWRRGVCRLTEAGPPALWLTESAPFSRHVNLWMALLSIIFVCQPFPYNLIWCIVLIYITFNWYIINILTTCSRIVQCVLNNKDTINQWRRNEFESVGGHRSGVKRRKKIFLVVPVHFCPLKAQLVDLVSAFVMVSIQFGQFLVCCSSIHGAPCPAICKSGGNTPLVPHGVDATAINQYRRHWSCLSFNSHIQWQFDIVIR